ncbi:hypothetical protein EFE42_02810 [Methanohalophilus sp. RSK]|uniref:hypothetical protein n=1 Tax=Methanohalophilus sp. RSK TaxID=2485783 RepID=UPI000F43DAFA|nr:hypothetical protein [Methanohalophilus sp. RSK]RNI14861.1 hypothetical protein EFE42_02810 [Methanohalophilus sp. RSK]
MDNEREEFWEKQSFVIITDNTKPAMKYTIDELTKRGKEVYIFDLSTNPDKGDIKSVDDIPDNVENTVLGITTSDPADFVQALKNRGFSNFWIHWRTETPGIEKMRDPDIQIIKGKCPMMYLGKDFSIHGLHRSIAKFTTNGV